MLIVFSISMLGHAFAHRIFARMARDFAFSPHLQRNLIVFNLLFIAFLTMLSPSITSLWLFIGILLITLKFFPPVLRIFLRRELQKCLIPFLDMVILGLQTGKSFRSSLLFAIESQRGWVRHQLTEIYDSMLLAENVIDMKSAVLKDLRRELVEIDRSKNRSIEQLRALRRELKMLESFRRRSGQVSQQIKMQAIIVTALFVALNIFVIKQFGFQENKNLILGAVLTFFAGLFAVFLIGRRLKWKV